MDCQQEFERIARECIDRYGIEDLLKWIAQTDFYTAPASTRFHDACEGGLVMHSLNVYSHLKRLASFYCADAISEGLLTPESIAIAALFHDLCKIGCYKVEMRWRKDANNQWEQYSTWKFDEDFAFGGHGSKSVYLVQNFIELSPDEASAINCHMGAWDRSDYGNPNTVYERNKLAWLLHVADEAASFNI